MSTLIFQVHIKQWDKSQRSAQDVAKREAMATRFAIISQPEFFILNQPCIIDEHNFAPNRILKKAMLSDGSVKLERFVISEQAGQTLLTYLHESQESASTAAPITIGNLNDGWIQAKYQWRYSVEQDNKIYWQYEEVTLNAVCVDEYDEKHHEKYFLSLLPYQEFCAEASAQ